MRGARGALHLRGVAAGAGLESRTREIMELENDVAVREEELKIFEEAIDSRLGLR